MIPESDATKLSLHTSSKYTLSFFPTSIPSSLLTFSLFISSLES